MNKSYQIPAEYSTKLRGKVDFKEETLQLTVKTFFLVFN